MEGVTKKRRLSTELSPMPSRLTLTDVLPHVLPFLSMDDAVRLSRVSKPTKAVITSDSKLSEMQGKRTVNGIGFWSRDPRSEPKRYFRPISATGQETSVPHISEQTGFETHLTDVAEVPWSSGLGSQLTAGNYPTKLQFKAINPRQSGYRLDRANLPKKPADGRVLVKAPPQANEPSGTFIETKAFNKASQGPLPLSYPRTRLSSVQATQDLNTVKAQWEGAQVKVHERPRSRSVWGLNGDGFL